MNPRSLCPQCSEKLVHYTMASSDPSVLVTTLLCTHCLWRKTEKHKNPRWLPNSVSAIRDNGRNGDSKL